MQWKKGTSRLLVLTFFCVGLLLGSTGCRGKKTSPADTVKVLGSQMTLANEQGEQSSKAACDRIANLLRNASSNEVECALNGLVGAFKEIPWDERSYPAREQSFSQYLVLIKKIIEPVCCDPEKAENAWKFQLAAMERVNAEIDRCRKEPLGGPYPLGIGPVTTQAGYVRSLKAKRFYAVRDGFERSRFSLYFHALPETKQKEWIRCLEQIAQRGVCIWNPERPFDKLPVYTPEKDELRTMDGDLIEYFPGGQRCVIKPVRQGVMRK